MSYKKNQVYVGDSNYTYELRGVAYLPHSCDEWELGTASEVKTLIDDLQALLDSGQLDERPTEEVYQEVQRRFNRR